MSKSLVADNFVSVQVIQAEAHVSKTLQPRGQYILIGKYSIFIDITATKETIYLPVSIGSGRKSTGVIYQIEGETVAGSQATISYKGEGTAIVTSGSISYCKIPVGKTASFKVFVDVNVMKSKEYRLVISRINYKLNPNDMRYKRFITELGTKFASS